jgi:hypothetical protein
MSARRTDKAIEARGPTGSGEYGCRRAHQGTLGCASRERAALSRLRRLIFRRCRSTLHSEFLNSLIPAKNSLFFEIFSLLICVGNCSKSDCGAAVSCYEIGLGSPEITKFPVKFPVSREFAWRRVRSALQRQPGIAAFDPPSKDTREWAGSTGFFAHRLQSLSAGFAGAEPEIVESLPPI